MNSEWFVNVNLQTRHKLLPLRELSGTTSSAYACVCVCLCVREYVCDSTTSGSIYWLHISFTSVSARRHRGAVSVSLATTAGAGILINQSNFLATAAAAPTEGETHLVPGWRISQGAPLPNGVRMVYVLRQHAGQRCRRHRSASEKIDSRLGEKRRR